MTLPVILWAGRAVAWTLIPLIIVQYRIIVVPSRYREISSSSLRHRTDGRAQTVICPLP